MIRPLRGVLGGFGLAAWIGLAASVHAAGPVALAAPAPTQLPTGGQVVAGQAQITQGGATMTVQQDTLRAVIDWQRFDLGSQAQLRFNQPSADAVTLNRVTGADPSQVMGRISAPGQVFLSNPQGVLFGTDARVDVGGLVATTFGIANADFMAGLSRFDRNGSSASVVNQGALTASPQGYIALLAPEVRNDGVITAQAGTAVLAAGEAITLNFGAPGRLSSITVTPAQIATLVENRRAVLAAGGQILIAARSAEQLLGSVVNSGELNATSLVRRGGRIVLEGDDIQITDSSRIEARGTADGTSDGAAAATATPGGGTVLIGGDWQGGGTQHQATRVTTGSGSRIDASATAHGDGGTVVLWSDLRQDAGATAARGTILARGGSQGGNGGRIETSGHAVTVDGLQVDAGAPAGKAGLWLIDPYDYAINAAAASAIGNALNTSDVTVTTTVSNATYGGSAVNTGAGDISVDSSITKTGSGTSTLTLQAGRRVRGSSDITTTSGPLNVVLWAGYAGSGGGVQVNNITSRGGSVWVGGSSGAAGSGSWNGLTVGNGPATGIVAGNSNGVDWYGTIDTRAASGSAGGDLLLWSGNGVNGGVGLANQSAARVLAGAGNATLRADTYTWSTNPVITSTGTFTFEPSGASFGQNLTNASFNLSGATLGGVVFGKDGNTSQVTIDNAMTVAGPIRLYGGNVNLNADLASTLAGAAIVVKGSGAIVTNTGRTLQTNGGAITLWGDSDANGGYIWLNQNDTLDSRTQADRTAGTHTTGGGKITLAGGAADGSGAPAGYALGDSGNTDRGGINLGDQTASSHNSNTQIFSGGGDVLMRGKATNGMMGINWVDSGTLNAGSTGIVSLNGINSVAGHGIEFGAFGNGGSSVTIRSGGGDSATPGITLTGSGSGSGSTGIQSNRPLTVLATGAGGITVSGTATGGYGYLGPLDFLAASGAIAIDGGSGGISSASGGTLGRKAGSAVTASSSTVTLTGGTLSFGGATTIDTTGTLTLQPAGASFTSAQTIGSTLALSGGVSGLTFGKPGNTANLTLNSAQTIAGPISFYGNNLTLNASIAETSSTDTTLLLQATGDINVNGASITSSNARLNTVFIADWDSSVGGAIYVNGGSTPVTFNTHGGNLWLGGNGYAPAYSTTTWNGLTVGTGAATSYPGTSVYEGVNLKGTTITTSGGNVYVAGINARYYNNENRYGVILQNGTSINTGSGSITLQGTLTEQTGSLSSYPAIFGVDLENSSLQTSTGNISISGGEAATSNSMNAGGYGVRLLNSTVRTTGVTGNIAIAGSIGTNAGTGATVSGVQLQAYGAGATTAVSTVGGDIAISGTANTGNGASSNGIELLTGQASNSNSNNPVVQVVSRTGNVSLTGDNPANTSTASTGIAVNGVNYGQIAIGRDGTNAYSGNTTVTGRSVGLFNLYSGYLTLGGSGALTIQPTGNSFVNGAATGQSLEIGNLFAFGSSHSAVTFGKDVGTAAKVDTITISNAVSAAGPISVYAGDVALNASLTTTLAGAPLLVKAGGAITTAASTAFQTANGNLTFWSDSDASGAGAIALGNSNTFNSAGGATSQQIGGGKITLAGGTDSNADGIPDGHAASTSANGLAFGTSNTSSTTVVSGGGDVLLKGKTSATSGSVQGVVANGALSVGSGQGAIAISGDSAASYGIEFSNYASGTALTLNSAKTSGTAIAITGTTTASSTHGVVFDNDAVENLLATGGGGIAITGTGTGTGYGVWLQNTNLLATSGAITVDGGSAGINVASGPAGSTVGKSTAGVTSSSNITLTGGRFNVGAATAIDTSGTVTLQPWAASFASAQSLSNLAIAASVTGLTFGKPGNTAGLTVGSAQAVAGPISLYGGDIGIAGTLTATAGDVLLRASGTLTMGAGSRAQASNGNLTATAARWLNQSGASALVAGGTGHQWQLWSSNVDPFNATTGDVRGGLAFDYKQYGASYGASTVLGAGNGLLYSYQPTVTAALGGSVSKVYDGSTAATLLGSNFSVVGSGVDGDQSLVLIAPASSAFASKNVGSGMTVTASGLTGATATSSSATGSKAVYGYGLPSSTASASIGSITPKALTATVAAPGKVYDGTTTAASTLTIASGLVGSETLGVTAVASFNSKDVASANLVTVSASTLADGANGGLAGNYSLAAGQTVAAHITPKALTATVSAPSKVYDGSAAAAPTLTIASGLVGSETVTAGASASFNSKDVASANLVTVSASTLADGANGGLAGNYSLAAGQTVAAHITPKALTATVAAPSKVYDGSAAAAPTLTIASGLVGSETVTAGASASFNSKDVAGANLVTVSATALADGANGGLAGNYSLAGGQTTAASITPKALTATVTAPDKVYDGTTVAAPILTVTSGLVGSETVTASGSAGFNSKDVASANLVTVSATALADGANGGLAGNYSLAGGQTTAASITPKALTATVTAPDKVYDGTTVAAPILTVTSGLVGSETVTASGSAGFNSKDVAGANLVTVSATALANGANGGLAGNYTLAGGQTTAASITPKALTATVTTPNKIYDGSAAASPTLTLTAGLVGGETLGVTGSAAFNSKDVATANTVIVGTTALADGSHGGVASNYTLAAGQSVAAAITPLMLDVTGLTANDRIYDATTFATLRGSASVTLVAGDSATLAGSATARFADKNVGAGKAVSVGGYTLVGGDAANYALRQPTGLRADVTPAALQIDGVVAQNKVYDGTTAVVLGGTATVAALGTDQLGLGGNLNAAFADRHAGSAKPVSVAGYLLTGADAANYVLAAPVNLAATITPATLDLAGSKVYDGGTAIAGSQLGATGVGGERFVVVGSGSSGNLASRNVQSGQPLASVDGVALGAGSNGALATDYLPLALATSRIDVTARPLVIGAAPVDKVYDGTTVADGRAVLVGGSLAAGDQLSGGAFAYADPNAGSAKPVSTSQVSVDDGNHGMNYSAVYALNQAVGRITPAPLTVTANDDAKFVTRPDTAGYNGVHFGGFVNGETEAVLGGNASITRLGGAEGAGLQRGVLVPSGLSAANYDIRYSNGSFTIVPAGRLLVRVVNQTTTYGNAAPGYTVVSAQYLDGNDVIETLAPSAPAAGADRDTRHYTDGAGGQATFTLGPVGAATSGAGLLKAGNYTIGASQVAETSANFSDTLTVVGQLTVEARVLSPGIGSGVSKVYDGTTAMGALQLSLSGAVAGDQLQAIGSGSFNGRNVGTQLGYTVGRLTLGGADAGNYVLQGAGGFSGSNGVITPKPVVLTAPVAAKVYDGNAGYTASSADLAALSAQLGVRGDAVQAIELRFGDRNVGTGKSVAVSGVLLDDGNGGANYVLTLVGNTSGSIARLGSVTWVGGASGSWFDPDNWAGGAVPDLRNVAKVVIPTGVRVIFDDAQVPALDRGAVFVEAIGSGAGSLQVQGGELNVGPGGLQLAALSQSGGHLSVLGDAALQTFAQSGGAASVAGNFTATQGYTQGVQGTLAVLGHVDLRAPLGDVVLGALRTTGGLDVATAGGGIRQADGTALAVGGATVLDAGRGDIVLGAAANDFIGPVSARGDQVTLHDTNALTLGTVVSTGNLTLASQGQLDLGRSDVGGALTVATGGGDIVQQGPLVVAGRSELNAGTGAVRLLDPSNVFTGGVASTASTTQLSGRAANVAPNWLMPTMPTPFGPPMPGPTAALDRAAGLQHEAAMVWLDQGSQAFARTLPTELIERVRRSRTTAVMRQVDGRPLPEWLRFDAATMVLSAERLPDGQLPLSLVLWIDGEAMLIRVEAQ